MPRRPGAILPVMERIVHVARDFREARAWDIEQHLAMTPEQRQRAAKELRDRVYGANCPDVREADRRR
jgi:hypothetical protein